ncbi:hypothetical protein K440DRAFT_660794 [Wilcoxina mikolae CBS 423.85]|nr:hypothetical protein K440DRAFT_660794 [Wilcoxina mikolae CBS 423.85]
MHLEAQLRGIRDVPSDWMQTTRKLKFLFLTNQLYEAINQITMSSTDVSSELALDSAMMTILVGPDKQPYIVHSDMLTKHSGSLRALYAGNWEETQTREIDWSEWEEATVKRFLQWIYTGSYSATAPNLGKTPNMIATYRQFIRRDPEGEKRMPVDKGDASTILMAHAKVYVLAQYTNTEKLEAVALKRFKNKILAVGEPKVIKGVEVDEAFVGVVEYAYDNTNSLVNSEEPLRRIISTYCADRWHEIQGKPALLTLLHTGGDFVVEFWEKVGRVVREDCEMRDNELEALSEKEQTLRRECATLRQKTLEIERLRSEYAIQMQEIERLRAKCYTLSDKTREVVSDNERIQGYNHYILQSIQDCSRCQPNIIYYI